MLVTFPHGGRVGMLAVTFVHVVPPSCVTCTRPSLDPVQITPSFTGDSAMANSVAPSKVMRLSVVTPPELCWCVVSLRVKSGLITCQLAPPSEVRCTNWLPTYTWRWSWGGLRCSSAGSVVCLPRDPPEFLDRLIKDPPS